jgi:hypothetical protein
MVLQGSPTLGERRYHNIETPEIQSYEVMRTIDIGTLQDLPWPLDLCQGHSDIDHSGSKEKFAPWIP